MSAKAKKRSLLRRILVWGALVVTLLVAVAVVVLRTQYYGPKLGAFVERQLNDTIRGRIEIDSIEWDYDALPTAVSGGWVPIRVYGFRLYDDYGYKVIDVPKLTGEIDAHAAMFGNHDLVLRNMEFHGGWAQIRMVEEPYPIHEYDENVVSILSAFYSRKAPSVYAGLTAAPRAILDFRDFHMRGVTLDIKLDYLEGLLEDVTADGFLYADDSDPLSRKLYYSLTGNAPTGKLSEPNPEQALRDGKPIVAPLANVEIHQLEQLPKGWPRNPYANDVEWYITADSRDARIELSGAMLDYWQSYFGGDYQTHLSLENGGVLASLLSDEMVSGDDLRLDLYADGPVLAPKVTVALRDANVAVPLKEGAPPLDLELESAAAQFDLATEEGYLENTVLHGAGGEVQLQSTFSLDPMQVDVNIAIPEAIELAPYLPPDVRHLAGSKLRGRMHAFGNAENQRIDDLHLWLGRAHLRGKLFREKGQIIHAEQLVVTLGDTRISSKGWVDAADETFDLALAFTSGDAGRYLRYYDAPDVANRVAGTARVTGTFDDPTARADLTASGVPLIDRVDATLGYRRDVLTIDKASSSKLGGSLTATGKVVLGGVPRIVGLEARARDIDLSRAPGTGGLIQGKLSGDFEASGRVDALVASGGARVDEMVVAGDPFSAFTVELEASRDGSQTAQLNAERVRGGSLVATITRTRRNDLGGVVTVRELPIESLAFLAARPQDSPVGGDLEADITLGGTLDAPTADGTVSLIRTWFGQAFLGAADLELKPLGDGKIGLTGHLFQGKLQVAGHVETRAPYHAVLDVVARRVEIDQFVPSLVDDYQMRGWFSGEVSIEADLMGNRKPAVDLYLTELTLLRNNVDPQGRPAPIRLSKSSQTPLVVAFDGTRAVLKEPVIFNGPAGAFRVTGSGTAEELALDIRGDIAVEMLQPYLRDYFGKMSGNLALAVNVAGPVDDPQVTGVVQFEKVEVQPLGQDALVSVPRGKVTVTPSQVAITDFTVRMIDRESDERAELTVRGGIGMTDFVPNLWALEIEGQLAGKMLLVAAPQIFSSASGTAHISVALNGPGTVPEDIDGSIYFACAEIPDNALLRTKCEIDQELTFTARGFRHELRFAEGSIRTATPEERDVYARDWGDDSQFIVLDEIGGWLDSEGRLSRIRGPIALHDWELFGLRITGSARSVPLRIPRTLDLTVDVQEFEVSGELEDRLALRADVEVIDGRYIRNFNLASGFFTTDRTTEVSQPFYEEVPLIANASLDINIDTRAFFVQNNVANIQLSGGVSITGTPSDPRIDGAINVDQGTFKFQGMRAKFTRTNGSVTFSRRQPFPDETPTMDLQSEADFRDSSGQEHVITLLIRGTLSNFTFDLYTDTGLNKAQTLTLISSGRTAEDLRQNLGDEAIGSDPTRIDSTADQGGNVYDELLKDLAGDFISLLIEDKLRDITKLDVARLEIGTTSVGFHAEKQLFENLKLLGDLQKTLRGWQWTLRGELRVSDNVSLEGVWLQRNQDDDAEEDTSEGRLRAVWRKGWQ